MCLIRVLSVAVMLAADRGDSFTSFCFAGREIVDGRSPHFYLALLQQLDT